MPSTALIEKRKEFESKQKKIMDLYDTAGDNYDFMKCKDLDGKTNKDRIEEIKKMAAELQDVKKDLDSLVIIENARRDLRALNPGDMKQPTDKKEKKDKETKSFGKMFVDEKVYEQKGKEVHIDCDVKTAFTRSAGWAPESIRSGLVVDYATRPIQIIDTIPGGTTNQSSYKYMEETTFTNNAAEVSEAGNFGEAALALTERSATVEKIGVNIPVTDEQLEDVVGIESYLNNRLGFMLKQRADYQVINGDGSTPNLQGMLNKTGIQTFVAGANLFDAIANAIKLIRTVGFATASVIYINSADWWSQKLRLKRDDNGNYILGGPNEPTRPNIWGVTVAENAVLAAGTIMVADTLGFTMLLEKRGITFKITDSHASEFIAGTQRIRADVRMVMVILRAAAICSITGC